MLKPHHPSGAPTQLMAPPLSFDNLQAYHASKELARRCAVIRVMVTLIAKPPGS